MTSARSILIPILGAVLTAPWIYAQEVKSLEAKVIHPSPPIIQELNLKHRGVLGAGPKASPFSAPWMSAHDLSTYREFQFGMNLLTVAKQADMKPAQARTIHQRPALIQELNWQSLLSLTSSQADPVRTILFSFCNDELFRIVINYDQFRTKGLSDDDMVEVISAKYGTATKPTAEITFSSSQVYNDSEKVIARWEDSQYSVNLFRSSYQPTFGMLVFSKRLDALAQAAIVEAIRLDEQQAPQREAERQKKQADEDHAAQEKARLVNKAGFRP